MSTTLATFGITALNAPGQFGAVDHDPAGALHALLVGAARSRVVTFDADGAPRARLEVGGEWRGLCCGPGGAWVLSRGEEVAAFNANSERIWSASAGYGSLARSLDHERIATYGSGGRAQIRSARTGQLLLEIPAKGGEIYAVAFSPDGSLVAVGEQKGAARVVDLATGEEIASRKSTKVLALAFSPDGRRIAAGHGQGAIEVWDAASLKKAPGFRGAGHRFEGVGAGPAGCRWIAWLADGHALASIGNERQLRVWDAATGQELRSIAIPQRHAQGAAAALGPNGAVVVGGTAGALSRIPTDGSAAADPPAPPTAIERLALDGAGVVAAGGDGFVRWTRDGRATRRAAAWSADVALLADGLMALCETDRVFVVAALDDAGPPAFTQGRSGPVAASRDGRRIAVPVEASVVIWDAMRRTQVARLPHAVRVRACAFGPDDAWIATIDDRLRVWSLAADEPAPVAEIALERLVIRGLAVSERGLIAVSADAWDNYTSADSSVVLVDPARRSVTATIDGAGERLGQLGFVGSSRLVVADSRGRLWIADRAGSVLDRLDPHAGEGLAPPFKATFPVAVRGREVAFVDLAGNVRLVAVEAPPEEVEAPAGALVAAQPAPADAGARFERRLAGRAFLLIGRPRDAAREAYEQTLRELGARVLQKPSADLTDLVVFRAPYGSHEAGAAETKVGARIAAGEPIRKLGEQALLELVAPTPAELGALLSGAVGGVERWNGWVERYGRKLIVRASGVDVSGADLRRARLEEIDLSGVVMRGVNLAGARLSMAALRGAILDGADLSTAKAYRIGLSDASLRSARLAGADLTWAALERADLTGADLTGARLLEADLRGADLRGATLPEPLGKVRHDASTRWPEGFEPPE